jgi:hypothetical protein
MSHLHAQNRTVNGKVTNEKSELYPILPSHVKGSTVGATTDENGNYLIKVPDSNAVLTFSSIGYQMQEGKLAASQQLISALKSSRSWYFGDVVVVGYGTQRKVTVTGLLHR